MPCSNPDSSLCHVFKHYIGSGEPGYHGEICDLQGGCPWWKNNPEDIAFKNKMRDFYEYCRQHPPTKRVGRK